MTPPLDESLHELSGSYAVHALTGAELTEFEAHLDDCERCRTDVREFSEALAALAETVEVAPPPALRSTVLAAISRTEQLPPADVDGRPRHALVAPPTGSDGQSSEPAAVPARSPVVGDLAAARERRGRRSGRGWIAAAAAAAVIAVGAGGWAVNLNRQLDHQQQTQVAGQQLSQREAALLNAPDAKIYSTKLSDGTPVSYVVSKRQNAAMLVGAKIGSPGSGKTWQLWTVRAAGANPFYRDRSFGPGTNQRVFMSGDIDKAAALGISVEPIGSTPSKPTGTPFGVVSL